MSFNLAQSIDGITWNTGIINPKLENFSKIGYGFNNFIAISKRSYNPLNFNAFAKNSSNVYSVSANGTNWTGKYINDFFASENFNIDINNIIFDNNKFITFPNNGLLERPNYILSGNLEPISWLNISNNFAQRNIPTTVSYGIHNGTGFWVGNNTRSQLINNIETITNLNQKFDIIKISTNGNTWLYPSQSLNSTDFVNPHKYVYGNNKFLAIFRSAPTTENGNFVDFHRVAYATNPNIWQQSNYLPIPQNFKISGAVIAQNNIFIIAGILNENNIPINSGLYSSDAINWSLISFPSAENWNIGTYGNNNYVLLSSYSNNILTSIDGLNWNISTPFTQNRNWSDIIYANNKFIAISNDVIIDENISSSSSSASFSYIRDTILFPSDNKCPYRLTYNQDSFVKLINTNFNNRYGEYQISTDGSTWENRGFPFPSNNKKYYAIDIDFGNNTWIVPTNENNDNIFTGYSPLLVTSNIQQGNWVTRNIINSVSNTNISGYAWSHIKYGNNRWVLAGSRKGFPTDIDGYINFMYSLFYKRLPTNSEILNHKNALGGSTVLTMSNKAKLVMSIIGFSSITNQISSPSVDYHKYASPIFRTFARFQKYGIPALTKSKYYEILTEAKKDNNTTVFVGVSGPNTYNGRDATNLWGLTNGTIKAVDKLAIDLIPSQGSQPFSKKLITSLGVLPDCSSCNCDGINGVTAAICFLVRNIVVDMGGPSTGTDTTFNLPQWIINNFPDHTYGAAFSVFHQFLTSVIYNFTPGQQCGTSPCGVDEIRDFEGRLATAFLRLMLLNTWPTTLNTVNLINESEVSSILTQFEIINPNYNVIFYSNDNGNTWNLSDYINENKPIKHIQYAFNKFFISTERNNDTIDGYISTDGINWVPGGFPRLLLQNTFPNEFELDIYNKQFISSDFTSENGTFIITSQSNKIFRSINSGDNFIDITNRITPIQTPRTRLKNIVNLSTNKWAISEEKFDDQDYLINPKLLISIDNGETWFTENFPIGTELNLPLASNKNNLAFAGGCNVGFIINSSDPIKECSLVVWGKSPINTTYTENITCTNIFNSCYDGQIRTVGNCLDEEDVEINPGIIYTSFNKYQGGGDESTLIDEPHIRVHEVEFYYKTPKTFYKFIEEIKGFGNSVHNINGLGTGYIDNPTGFQPAVTYITGKITGQTTEIGEIIIDNIKINELNPIITPIFSEDGLSVSFNSEELPCTGECITNKIVTNKMFLDYATGYIQATGYFKIDFNKLSIGDTLYIGENVYTFSDDLETENNFLNINNLISGINNSTEVYVELTGNNNVFLKSKLLGESGNYTQIYRRSSDPLAIITPNRFMVGGEHLRIFSNTWDGEFNMPDSDQYIYYNTGNYSRFYQIVSGEPIINSIISDVVWEDSFKNTWSIITGLNEDGGVNRSTGIINYNNNLGIFLGTGIIPSGRGEFLEYSGLNILISKQNPYNITGYIVQYLISGNNFIFSGFLN